MERVASVNLQTNPLILFIRFSLGHMASLLKKELERVFENANTILDEKLIPECTRLVFSTSFNRLNTNPTFILGALRGN